MSMLEMDGTAFESRKCPEYDGCIAFLKRPRKYRVRIHVGGAREQRRRVMVGLFDTIEDASAAYKRAKDTRARGNPPTRGLARRDAVDVVREYLMQNLGCKKKEVIGATGLSPKTVQRAIRIIRESRQ